MLRCCSAKSSFYIIFQCFLGCQWSRILELIPNFYVVDQGDQCDGPIDHYHNRTERLSSTMEPKLTKRAGKWWTYVLFHWWSCWSSDLAEYLGQCPIVSPLPWSLHWASEHHRWIGWYKDKPSGLYRFSSPKLGGSADFPKNQVILGSSPQLWLLCTPTSVVGRLLWLNQIKINPLPILDTLGKVIGWAAFLQDTSEFPSLKSSAKSSNMFKVHYSSQGFRFITDH